MKKFTKSFIAVVLGAMFFTTTAFAANVNTNVVTVLSEVKNINKIVATGNVQVVVVQSAVEHVKVYDSYYAKNALVQQKGNVLRVSSFEKEPLLVTVYVKNLSTIEASDNATVSTFGKAAYLGLDIYLKDDAKAVVDAKTISLFASVKGNASITLNGETEEYFGLLATSASINTNGFVAKTSTVKSIQPLYVAQNKAKASLADVLLPSELDK